MVDAQARVGRRYGLAVTPRPTSPGAWFFLTVFVPAYRRMPWKLRLAVIRAMPGSHRRTWHPRERRTGRPAV